MVTGGGAGIGRGISKMLAAAGAKVVINDIAEEHIAAAVGEIESGTRSGIEAEIGMTEAKEGAEKKGTGKSQLLGLAGDIRESKTVEELKSAALDFGGGAVDILINNVGDYRPSGWFIETDEAQWMAQFEITLKHVFECTKAFLPVMVEQKSGVIINNSTVEAFRACPHNSVYTAFNSGITAFTRTLAVEHGKDNIRVNAIAPDMANTLQTPAEAMLGERDPELIGSWIPLGRFGEPEDYGKVVLFLASDLASFVTGQTIMVDGGTMAASGWYGRYKKKGWTNLPDNP